MHQKRMQCSAAQLVAVVVIAQLLLAGIYYNQHVPKEDVPLILRSSKNSHISSHYILGCCCYFCFIIFVGRNIIKITMYMQDRRMHACTIDLPSSSSTYK
jgi:hypothetical protein